MNVVTNDGKRPCASPSLLSYGDDDNEYTNLSFTSLLPALSIHILLTFPLLLLPSLYPYCNHHLYHHALGDGPTIVRLPKLLLWYGADFGSTDLEVLNTVLFLLADDNMQSRVSSTGGDGPQRNGIRDLVNSDGEEWWTRYVTPSTEDTEILKRQSSHFQTLFEAMRQTGSHSCRVEYNDYNWASNGK